MSSPRSARDISTLLFVWLFALAVSTRVVYPEPVQMTFVALMLAYAWASPTLRESVLMCLKKFFARGEGKVALLLLLSATLTTALSGARLDLFSGVSLWLDWLLVVLFAGALFGCTAFLALELEALRRAFRLVGLCLVCAMLLWVWVLAAAHLKGGLTLPYFAKAALYWSYSQAGMTVIFFPLLFAFFGCKGMSLSNNLAEKIAWRACVSVALCLLFAAAVITERRIVGVALLASLLVLAFALGLKSRFRRWLPVLLLGFALCLAALLLYLYSNPVVYGTESRLCDVCNSPYLPLWLVDDARQAAWYETLVVWREHPWLGRGIHNDLSSFTHPHSRFLQVLSGLGIVGFGLFLWLLALVFVKACAEWARTGALSAVCLMFVHGVYWATGLFELSIWSLWHFGMYACALVMSVALDRLSEGSVSLRVG